MLALLRPGLALSALLLVSTSAAQQGSFTTFGTGCNMAGLPVPAIGSVGTPRIGMQFTVTYRGPNEIQPGLGLTDQPFLVVGATRVDRSVPPFLPLQPTTCTLYPALDVVIPMPPDASGTRFVDTYPVAVPNLPALIGASAWFQWVTPHVQCFFVGCGLGWVAFSDGGEAVVGM